MKILFLLITALITTACAVDQLPNPNPGSDELAGPNPYMVMAAEQALLIPNSHSCYGPNFKEGTFTSAARAARLNAVVVTATVSNDPASVKYSCGEFFGTGSADLGSLCDPGVDGSAVLWAKGTYTYSGCYSDGTLVQTWTVYACTVSRTTCLNAIHTNPNNQPPNFHQIGQVLFVKSCTNVDAYRSHTVWSGGSAWVAGASLTNGNLDTGIMCACGSRDYPPC